MAVTSVCPCGRTFKFPAAHVQHAARCPDANQRPAWADEPPGDAYALDRARRDEQAGTEAAS